MTVAADLAPIAVGRYRMYQIIGSGGMATVHLGRLVGAEGFGRTVAIKRLRSQFLTEPEMVQAFLDEARLATRIRHPNVVTTIDVVTKNGEVFLVMEYVDGEPLSGLYRRSETQGRTIPPPVAVAVVVGALRGLHAAHEAVSESGEPLNIVHRDVSPHNILVGVDGLAQVLDFGIAKALGRQQTTRDGRIKGKFGYMAPEQLSGHGVTRKTDVFAMGIVLWELLTGRRLFRGNDEAQTITRVLFGAVAAPSTTLRSSPRELDPIVLRALERDPIKRFASAEEMAAALESVLTPATPGVVGEWVRSVAEDDLKARALRVRDIEMHSKTGAWPDAQPEDIGLQEDVSPTAASTGTADPTQRTGTSRAARVAIAGLAVTALALGAAWITRGRSKAPPLDPPSSATPVAAVEPEAPLTSPSVPPISSALPGASARPAASVSADEPPFVRSAVPVGKAPSSRTPKNPHPPKPANSSRTPLYGQE
jgi:eukaryotic-like serine/threonine-protein kinase